VSADRQFAIGAIFSSPLVANGVVYFGSTDGFLYALE
jgi:outer membrane protein assembly factor BamB